MLIINDSVMNKILYVRFSSTSQNGERQTINAEKYDAVYEECVSGTIPFSERPIGKKLMADILSKKVGEVCVIEVSRIGRSLLDVCKMIEFFTSHNVKLTIENMGISSLLDNGSKNPTFQLVIGILATIAEQEKEAIVERTSMGRVNARLKGVVFGRKEGWREKREDFMDKPSTKEVIKLLNKNKYTYLEIQNITGVGPVKISKIKKMLQRIADEKMLEAKTIVFGEWSSVREKRIAKLLK
jgi:DNA invertase Pin-like site-specific DNA recombinase